MKRKKSKSPGPSASRQRTTPSSPRISREAALRLLICLGWATAFGGVAYGLQQLEPAAHRVYGQSTARLHWVDLPVWLADPSSRPILAAIERRADLLPEDDVRAPELCERVAANLADSPWIAQLDRVSKQADGLVHVRARFRKPLGFAVRNDVAYYLAEDGVRLPGVKGAAFLGPTDGIAVVGLQGPVPSEGEKWSGEEVAAGVRLVKYLNEATVLGKLPCAASLRAVDVSEYRPAGGPLLIRTVHPNSVICWGLPPGDEYDIEAAADRKLATLATLYITEAQLPADEWIDIRDPEGYVYRGRRR